MYVHGCVHLDISIWGEDERWRSHFLPLYLKNTTRLHAHVSSYMPIKHFAFFKWHGIWHLQQFQIRFSFQSWTCKILQREFRHFLCSPQLHFPPCKCYGSISWTEIMVFSVGRQTFASSRVIICISCCILLLLVFIMRFALLTMRSNFFFSKYGQPPKIQESLVCTMDFPTMGSRCSQSWSHYARSQLG